eukprot:5026457-Alexandrium_andersonii.AAC.1
MAMRRGRAPRLERVARHTSRRERLYAGHVARQRLLCVEARAPLGLACAETLDARKLCLLQ